MINNYYDYFNGNKDSFKKIIEEFSQPLYYFIISFVKDDFIADDILEDVFVSLLIKKRTFKNSNSFKSYLFATARNKSINYLKRNKLKYIYLNDNYDKDETDPQTVMEEQFNVEMIRLALKKLNCDYYAVIYLSFYEDLKNYEIAKIMKKSTKQVENLLYRAKIKVKNILKEMGYDESN